MLHIRDIGCSPLEDEPPASRNRSALYSKVSIGSCPFAIGDNLDDDILSMIIEFADWAFGADGLPNLQILASGDFSYQGLYAYESLILCKTKGATNADDKKRNFRPLGDKDSDPDIWEFIRENMDMLAACPVDPIFEPSDRPQWTGWT